jgi:hypothetical protein
VNDDVIAGGYGDGHVRVFNMTTGKMMAEIAAHARWVSAVDISSRGLVSLSIVWLSVRS